MLNNNRILEIVENSLKNMQNVINVDTVVGSPIKSEHGEIIIPVSKVAFGVITGGGEYGKVNIFKTSKDCPYSAGNGSIVSVQPCAFLIKNKKGDYKVVSVGNSNYQAIIDKVAGFFESLRKDENDDQKNA